MDGLECNEFLYSKVIQSNKTHRLDPEYYSKIAMIIEEKLLCLPHFFLPHHRVVSGPFGSTLKSSAYLEKGDIPFVRIEDIKGGFHISRENLIYISNFDNGRIANSQLQEDDIILSKVGNSIGYFARVDTELHTCNISENNIGIKLLDYATEVKHTILAYLNSRYGKILILRRRSGNAQPKLNVDDVCYIPIPSFSGAFCSMVSSLIIESDMCVQKAASIYRNTESLLLSALNYHPIVQTQGYSKKNFSSSFGATGRLDAEYYQPKYDEVCANLHTSDTVHSLCVLHDQNFIPNEKQKYAYIELADVGQMGEISGIDPVCGAELPTRARRRVEAGQVIISSIEGSLQSCALITDEFNGALCSTGFYILTSESLNPESLLVLFKSEPIQALMKQRCSGTILTAISKDELLSMPLPKIDDNIQELIAEKIQKSFSLRRQSKQLLENAKHAVEMAIEQGEDKAMRWLQEQGEI